MLFGSSAVANRLLLPVMIMFAKLPMLACTSSAHRIGPYIIYFLSFSCHWGRCFLFLEVRNWSVIHNGCSWSPMPHDWVSTVWNEWSYNSLHGCKLMKFMPVQAVVSFCTACNDVCMGTYCPSRMDSGCAIVPGKHKSVLLWALHWKALLLRFQRLYHHLQLR